MYENCGVNDPLEPLIGDDCEAAVKIENATAYKTMIRRH